MIFLSLRLSVVSELTCHEWRLRPLVFMVCPAALALVRPLSADFQMIEHVESLAEPIGGRDHSDRQFSISGLVCLWL